jgi:hypothetical protein
VNGLGFGIEVEEDAVLLVVKRSHPRHEVLPSLS